MSIVDVGEQRAVGPAYARFLPRVRALLIDAIVILVATYAAVAVAVAIRSDDLARPLGFAVLASWLLYEPLLVAYAGGTIGHRLANLRVVDDRTGGNVSLLKAFARTTIKAVLGWLSFVTMLATRRSQAIHDLLTRSTVQLRDQSRAAPSYYVHERTELSDPARPSRTRRVLVIVVYLLLACVMYLVAFWVLYWLGLFSQACVLHERCSPTDHLATLLVVGCLILVCAACIGFGWRGGLFGARRRR
jgi:uncharacterized RDD family membrane protein YckC